MSNILPNDNCISETLIDDISNMLYKVKYDVEYNPQILKVNPGAETPDHFSLIALGIIDRLEDSLSSWPHTKSYLFQINEDFAGCILDDIHHTLDQLGIPRGTFGDEHFYNFVVMYNNRGKYLKGLEAQIDATAGDEKVKALQEQVNALSHVLQEIANWPEYEGCSKFMRTAATSVISPEVSIMTRDEWENMDSDVWANMDCEKGVEICKRFPETDPVVIQQVKDWKVVVLKISANACIGWLMPDYPGEHGGFMVSGKQSLYPKCPQCNWIDGIET